jgi:hypothetical protein
MQGIIKYVSTSTLSEYYEVSKEFFLRRKESGEFEKNIHYIQQGNTLRWDFEKIKLWWFGNDIPKNSVESILNKVIPN